VGSRIIGGGLILATLLGAILVGSKIVIGLTAPPLPIAGERAPTYSATTLQGAPIGSSALAGQVVMLDFWASWCPGCMASLPNMRRLAERFEGKGVTVIGVSQEPDDVAGVREIVREKGLRYPIVLDHGAVRDAFRIRALPTVVVIDQRGVVRAVHEGPVTEDNLAWDIVQLLD